MIQLFTIIKFSRVLSSLKVSGSNLVKLYLKSVSTITSIFWS